MHPRTTTIIVFKKGVLTRSGAGLAEEAASVQPAGGQLPLRAIGCQIENASSELLKI